MSKKNGALFSKALFGYKKSDVNEYIRQSDSSHDNQMVLLKDERDSFEKRVMDAEKRIKELENALVLERDGAKEAIKKLSAEYESKLLAAKKLEDELKLKLLQEEEKAATSAELAASMEARAESAEAEASILSVELESARSEIEELNGKLSDKGEESKRLAELDEYVGRYAVQHDEERRNEKKSKISVKKKPLIFRLVKKK